MYLQSLLICTDCALIHIVCLLCELYQIEEEKLLLERRVQEAEMVAVRLVEDFERR